MTNKDVIKGIMWAIIPWIIFIINDFIYEAQLFNIKANDGAGIFVIPAITIIAYILLDITKYTNNNLRWFSIYVTVFATISGLIIHMIDSNVWFVQQHQTEFMDLNGLEYIVFPIIQGAAIVIMFIYQFVANMICRRNKLNTSVDNLG